MAVIRNRRRKTPPVPGWRKMAPGSTGNPDLSVLSRQGGQSCPEGVKDETEAELEALFEISRDRRG
jgi:hypothetical protein